LNSARGDGFLIDLTTWARTPRQGSRCIKLT
jgi:hypothetical protein